MYDSETSFDLPFFNIKEAVADIFQQVFSISVKLVKALSLHLLDYARFTSDIQFSTDYI